MTEAVAHSTRAHADLGASNSHIWLACTGSVALSRGRERKATVHTRAGTCAHQLGEKAILDGTIDAQPGDLIEVEGEPVQVTDEMLDGVQYYATICATFSDGADWVLVEGRFSLDDLWPGKGAPEPLFGTGDYSAVLADALIINDLKFGKGKIVDPEANPQLLYYAMGAFFRLQRERPELVPQIKRVILAITQPRTKDRYKQWEIPLVDLLAWAYGDLKPTVERIAKGDTSLAAGNHCFFCVAAPVCPALHEAKVQRAVEAFPEYEG